MSQTSPTPISPDIDWIHQHPKGFYCVPGDFFIDPHRPVSRALISHAHGDHFPRISYEVWATRETLALGAVRSIKAPQKAHAVAFKENFQIGEVEVCLYPAGHMLGSAQLLLRYRGQSVLYSGDFALGANPTCRPLAYPEVKPDLLICESTFGLSGDHPSPEEALKDCLEQAGQRPILIAAYAMGKAQRITALMSKHFPEIPLFIHRDMLPIHKKYESLGVSTGKWDLYYRQKVKKIQQPYALILPPRVLTGYDRDQNHYKVFASGWDLSDKRKYYDGRLHLSDHADATETLQYIERIAPAQVAFWHGYPEKLIESCQKKGIPAFAIRE